MRKSIVAAMVLSLLSLAGCQTAGDGNSVNFRSNANKALSDNPYLGASR